MDQLPVIIKRCTLPVDLDGGVYFLDTETDCWKPSRALPFTYNPIRNLFIRFKLAYGVFTGRYDALDWS